MRTLVEHREILLWCRKEMEVVEVGVLGEHRRLYSEEQESGMLDEGSLDGEQMSLYTIK